MINSKQLKRKNLSDKLREIENQLLENGISNNDIINVADIKENTRLKNFLEEKTKEFKKKSIFDLLICLQHYACEVPKEDIDDLRGEFKKLGYIPEISIDVRELPKRVYNKLLSLSPKIQGRNQTSIVLKYLGFDSDLKVFPARKLRESLKTHFPKSVIEDILFGRIKRPSIQELRNNLEGFHSYELSSYKHPFWLSWKEIANSIYPEYPNLSLLLCGKVTSEIFSFEGVSNFLKGRYETLEDISVSALKEYKSGIFYKWLKHFSLKYMPRVEIVPDLSKETHLLRIIKKKDCSLEQQAIDFFNKFYAKLESYAENREMTIEYVNSADQSQAHKNQRFSQKPILLYSDSNITRLISLLTGVPQSHVKSQESMLKRIGTLFEYFTNLAILGLKKNKDSNVFSEISDIYPENLEKIILNPNFEIDKKFYKTIRSNGSKGLKLLFNGNADLDFIVDNKSKTSLADLVVFCKNNDSCVVEVKYVSNVSKDYLKKLEHKLLKLKYSHWLGINEMKDINKVYFFVHSNEKSLLKIKEYLIPKIPDLEIIGTNDFKGMFSNALEDFSDFLIPNVCSPDEINKFYQEFLRSVSNMTSEDRLEEFRFVRIFMNNLLYSIEKNEKPKKYPEIIVYGKKPSTDLGFKDYKISLIKNIPGYKIRKFVLDNIDLIPEHIMFNDIETMGFKNKPIFLAGFAYRQNKDIIFDIPFTPNPLKEKNMLSYFSSRLKYFSLIVTYNGLTFDLPFINNRFETFNLSPKINTKKNHVDIYNLLNKNQTKMLFSGDYDKENFDSKISLKLSKLWTKFGDSPREDIGGHLVPTYFRQYLLSGDSEKITELIHHNVLDILTTIALFLKPDYFIKESRRILTSLYEKNS